MLEEGGYRRIGLLGGEGNVTGSLLDFSYALSEPAVKLTPPRRGRTGIDRGGEDRVSEVDTTRLGDSEQPSFRGGCQRLLIQQRECGLRQSRCLQ